METSDWWVGQIPTRVVWRFAGMKPGGPSVMNTGQLKMPMWPAGNWDF